MGHLICANAFSWLGILIMRKRGQCERWQQQNVCPLQKGVMNSGFQRAVYVVKE
jgi:hypothetical protein